MAGKIYTGTYTTTILLTTASQNPVTLTGQITAGGTNAASGSGFYSNVAFAWSIINLGRITTTGPTSYGIALLDGGTITNGSVGGTLGLITSDETGIFITGAAATLTNDGSITGIAGRGVFFEGGGTVTNGASNATHATIKGGFEGVAVYNAGGSVTNFGTILATNSFGFGVEIYAGTVANMAGGQIGGAYGVGFVAHQAVGTLTNAGTITGRVRDAVAMTDGGTVINSGSLSGAIAGVLALYGSAIVSNTGVIAGQYAAVDLLDGGAVTNAVGARISGGFGVSVGNGTMAGLVGSISNSGTIVGATYEGVSLGAGGNLSNAGSIYGKAAGAAAFYGAASITNTGVISAQSIGVKLGAGGTLTNASGASISGGYGVVLANGGVSGVAAAPSALSNSGQITGSGSFGAEILTNGLFRNQAGGTIVGGRYGAYIESVTGTLANYGTISGQVGVYGREVVANGHQYPGQLTVLNAGTITGTGGVAVSLFASHDLLIDDPGAVFNGAVDGGGGQLELAAGAGAIGAVASSLASFATITVDGGASWAISGSMATNGTLLGAGTLDVAMGTVRLAGTVVGTGTIAIGHAGIAVEGGTIESGERIVFTDPLARLTLPTPLLDAATQVGFAAGDTIYLSNLVDFGLSESYAPAGNGGTLTVSQSGSVVARLGFQGQYTAASFAIGADHSGGTDLSIPCFVAGTAIATQAGEAAVEQLRAGMRVATAGGVLRPIVWVGRRGVDVGRHENPDSVRPVRIAAGSFGVGRPRRDLLLSPDHAVFFDGVLIPVRLLVNGGSIRAEDVAYVRYLHVELDRHDCLLAEGLAVESFLDSGNRYLLGLGDGAAAERAGTCAPMALGGAAVARARRHVLAQAVRRGSVAEPCLRGPGGSLRPVRREAGRLWYLVPEGVEQLDVATADGWRVLGAILDGRALSGLDAVLTLPPAARARSLELVVRPVG